MSHSQLALAGLRLLLTRPAGQSEAWQQALQQLGAALHHVPVIAIEPIALNSQTCAAFAQLQRYDLAIFVSTNAVRFAHSCLVEQQVSIPANLSCLAVGDKTGSAAVAAGFNARETGAVDSETLLALPELQSVQGKRVLIFRGQGGRELITQTLRARGAAVTHAELYRRDYPGEHATEMAEALSQWRPHAVVVTSVAGVQNLDRMAAAAGVIAQLHATPLVTPGARVTAAAQASNFARVLTARSMRLSDVSYALCNWWRSARADVANKELRKAK